MKSVLLFFAMTFATGSLQAQLVRERVVADRPVENTFFSQKLALLQTTESISKQEMLFSIMHVFGPINTGVNEFWGMDVYANIRLGLEYGLTDDLSIGIGRSKLDKSVDVRTKYRFLKQMESGSMPVSVALIANTAIDTRERADDPAIGDRLSFMGSALVARKFSDRFSAQVAPTLTHFNLVRADQENTAISVGVVTRFRYAPNRAVGLEATPVIVGANSGSVMHYAVNYEMETGGHVFQLFVSVGDGLSEQYAITRSYGNQLRFGFNVNRIFRIGERY
jgi:hypothetical protein